MPTKRGRGIIYARPSFLEGMARVFDIGGTLNEYDFGPGGAESDAEALRSDWEAIGDDWRAVIGNYDHYYLIKTKPKEEVEPES